jgi:hypothetical protein
MTRRSALALMVLVSVGSSQEPPKITPGSLTIEDVLGYVKAGLPDEIIIIRVKRNARAFDLNADEVQALQKQGVTGAVIRYLFDPNLPYTPPPPPPPGAPVPLEQPRPKPPTDPLALKVPPEPGIYYLTAKQEFQALDLKPVVPSKQPGKSMLPLPKGHIIGSVVGPTAKTRLPSGSAIFYVRLPEKVAAGDLALLSLKRSRNRRDLDFGTKPGKPVFSVNALKQFESKEVTAGMFRFLAPLKQSGEYLFFVLGSDDEKKGLLGRGYDFGVD